jgi:D-alanyl-D-alanine carboxypeptidase
MTMALMAGGAQAGPSILVDIGTGEVLAQEDVFHPWHPASLTKLMTVYVTFRSIEAGEIQLDSPVHISKNATEEPPSKMGYPAGSVLTVDNAIKILMVKSANDVATALAETVGGSESAFVSRMNAEARRLGMTGSRFANAHGLHVDEQVTTARDLAILARTMRREFPKYAHYFAIEAIEAGGKVIETHNNLIMRFEGANGMKTGYTCPSGFNLIATATRGTRSLMAVVIGEPSVEARADKAANLLAQGFAQAPGGEGTGIAELKPSAAVPALPTNMRSMICVQAHWEALAKKRGPGGDPAYTSVHIKEPTREPFVVEVALGGATGPESTVPRYADVPIPTPRPAFLSSAPVAEGG